MIHLINSTGDIVALVLLFGITIFVHELGHFLTALWCGMVIDTFSIGFGPSIWQKKIRGVKYKIGWIPFGGYVSLPQLDPSGMAAIQGEVDGEQKELPRIKPWKKILVSVSGAVGNVMFAVLLAWVIFLSPEDQPRKNGGDALIGFVDTNSVAYARGIRPGHEIVGVNGEAVSSWNEYSVLCMLVTGQTNAVTLSLRGEDGMKDVTVPTQEGELGERTVNGIIRSLACVVRGVVEGRSAEEAGIREGDVVCMFDGEVVASTQHFIALVEQRPDMQVPIVVDRDGKLLTLAVTPKFDALSGKALIGVHIGSEWDIQVMPWMFHREPSKQIKGDVMGIARILRALVTPKEARQAAKGLGGPVMILATLWVSIKISLLNAVGFLRFLNVNLAIINLLPIPVLDGGHIVFSLWEGVTRRRANPKVVNALVNVFATLLIGVIIILSLRDVMRTPKLLRALGLIEQRSEPGDE